MTERNRTTLGNLISPRNSTVDDLGLVRPWGSGWTLDWWIGADDRWHFPSRDEAIRQRLVTLTPVVETAMRTPGGDAVQRVYAVRGPGRSDELLVIEVENASPAPFAVAFALAPVATGGISEISLDERTVMVDGRPALYLPRRPSRFAVGGADLASIVASGGSTEQFEVPTPHKADISAAFIYPVAHTTTLRVSIPLVTETGRRLSRRRNEPAGGWLPAPDSLPAAADAARAWQAQTRRGMRVELPLGRLTDVIEANRRFLLLAPAGAGEDELLGGRTFADSAALSVSLDRFGFHEEAADVIAMYPPRQHLDGRLGLPRSPAADEPGANGAVLWAIGEHHRLTGDGEWLRPMIEMIAGAARWIERQRHGSPRRRDSIAHGLLASRRGEFAYADSMLALRGLLDAADVLRVVGEAEAAETAAAWAVALRSDLDAALVVQTTRSGVAALPPGPGGTVTAASMGALVGCSRLGLYPPSHPAMAATADAIRNGLAKDQGITDPDDPGRAPALTLQLASVELQAADRRAIDHLAWVAETASDTLIWPGGTREQDLATTVEFCLSVRDLLVREFQGGLALCSLLPEGWLGQPVEVHDAPTAAGVLSFAIRWHGERPAVLWELRPRHDAAIRLTAPGLDPSWSSTETSGEALLAPWALP